MKKKNNNSNRKPTRRFWDIELLGEADTPEDWFAIQWDLNRWEKSAHEVQQSKVYEGGTILGIRTWWRGTQMKAALQKGPGFLVGTKLNMGQQCAFVAKNG